ncbi:inositol-1,4,5-triphosphate 5-phosphatase [Scheffersomyces xylosifermentans]|uniref:inositol-1,4,5-triphosphate 5-phosphatase n=1 Tax=Scheffersomyces xylosifermentans TaxID=1304137 RepID=UPI00315D7CED
MKLLYKENPRTIALYSDTHSLLLRQQKKSSKVSVEIATNNQVTRENGYRALIKREVFGCLGLIHVDHQVFVSIITGAALNIANPLNYETVDKIFAVDFISLASDEWDFVNFDTNGVPVPVAGAEEDSVDYPRAPHPCHDLKKLLSNGSFYFSNDFDLTSLLQNRGISNTKLFEGAGVSKPRRPAVEHYRREYMWNSFLMEELIQFKSNLDPYAQEAVDDNRFLTTVIRGFAKTIPLNSSQDSLTIISKQSWRRAGTRFNVRGIDDDGHVANFVETEFIYFHPSQSSIFSFTQIRGSVPTFWEQDSSLMNPKITLTRSLEATQPIFNKHFKEICENYGVCHIVNLLSMTKPAEVAVSNRYKELYKHAERKEEISYTEFDFHSETKPSSGGFAGATKILPLLHSSQEQFGWFVYDIEQEEVVTRQDGIFRTNCLDCLDRTNLIQQVLCQNVLDHILKNQSASYGNSYRDRYAMEDIIVRHNSLWADNGDAISQIYTGTNALKSSFSRSGKMNIAGALSDVTKSVSRMYQNTFVDGKKQYTMDLLLGKEARSRYVKIFDPINDYVNEQLKNQSNVFTTWNDITVFVGTYNLNALEPDSDQIDLTSWLFPPENMESEFPDIFAIGLQELIELNAGSILNADGSKPLKWAKVLNEQLNSQKEQYLLLRTESIASMSLFLFVKKSQVHNVTQVAGSSKKTGLGGITANKGACAVRFEFGSTSFAMITSHLAAGTTAVVERFNDYSTIMQGLTFTRGYTIKDHDHVLWFGDLNYRIALPNEHCRSLIESGAFDELLALDQLNDEITQKGAFHGFKEGAIKFYPTYKFDKGTSEYDSSEKQRVPSWTDRILHMTAKDKQNLKLLNYNSVMDIVLSDHKPVYATYNSKVEFIDKDKKMKMAKSLYDGYKTEHPISSDNLLDLSATTSVSSRETESTNGTDFTSDTLSDMHLLDIKKDHSPPSVSPRKPVNNGLRRVPPPPSSRRSVTTDMTTGKATLPRKLPPNPYSNDTTNSLTAPPPPPPARKINSGSLAIPTPAVVNPPIGFSSAPLIPSRSNSATPNRAMSPTMSPGKVLPPAKTMSPQLSPMVPSKPTTLTATKIKHEDAKSESDLTHDDKPKASAPSPPPRRVGASVTPDLPKSISDWKPLVPK